MSAFVVPTLGIDAVDSEHLQLPSFDFWCEHANHARVFVFEETPHGAWKDKHRLTGMSKNERFHIPAEFVAVSLVIFPIHRRRYLT